MPSRSKNPKRIIIIDDDEDLLYTFNHWLLNKRYLTIALTNADNLVSMIASFCPHLIVIDVRLKEADGRDVCRYIKQDLHFKNPVLLFSLHNYEERTITASLADGFFLKSSDYSTMIQYIAQFLE